MKSFFKNHRIFFAFFIICSSFLYAENQQNASEKDLYEYNNIVAKLEKTSEPFVTEDYVVFTQKTGPRFLGIAFDFENYQTIHPFMKHTNYDYDGNTTTSVMFYILERPKNLKEISYRLIIDGLWTSDPNNSNLYYENNFGLSISKVDLGEPKPKVTNSEDQNGTKFIYNGEPGQTVRIAGTFTNWDSWIYELKETEPGYYELNIPLPSGKYYYNYYLGMNRIVDKTNPNRAYTSDGITSSVIVVQ